MTSLGMRRRCRAPLGVGVLAAATAAVLYIRDPRSSSYLPCPIHAVTGLWCPGCGATRVVGDLVRGDIPSALSTNVLAVVLLAVGVVTWVIWVRARIHGRMLQFRQPPAWLLITSVCAVVAFTVLRNIPAGSWLAPQ